MLTTAAPMLITTASTMMKLKIRFATTTGIALTTSVDAHLPSVVHLVVLEADLVIWEEEVLEEVSEVAALVAVWEVAVLEDSVTWEEEDSVTWEEDSVTWEASVVDSVTWEEDLVTSVVVSATWEALGVYDQM